MLKAIRVLPVCLALLAIAAVPGAASETVRANVPYPLHAGGTLLSPGVYTFHVIDTGSDAPALMIESEEGIVASMVVVRIAANNYQGYGKSELEIERKGEIHRLQKIWIRGKGHGYQVPMQ